MSRPRLCVVLMLGLGMWHQPQHGSSHAFQSPPWVCHLPPSSDHWALGGLISRSTTRKCTTSPQYKQRQHRCGICRRSTHLAMVFDFFKQRTQEGFDQLNNLATAAGKGELGRGLQDVAAYTRVTNQAFATGLAKSRVRLLQQMETALTGVSPEQVLEDLQDVLLQADLGLSTAEDIVEEVRSLRADATTMLSRDDLKSIMRGKLSEALDTGKESGIQFATKDENIPTVLFVMGANGMGKTTTIGKLAYRLRTELHQRVLVAACDTFRAGAVDQLQMWVDRAGVDMVGPDDKASTPSAVLYKTLDRALAESYDTVLVDTSGRLSNNDALTAELSKMKRVIQKRLAVSQDENNGNNGKPLRNLAVPHETLLVIDAAQGRMTLDSAQIWNEQVGLTGLIVTKLDGSARGGSVVAVSRNLKLPVKLIGVGEGIEDLRDFDAERFVDGLLGVGAAGGASTNEGVKLAARLAEMRRERDERALIKKKDPIVAMGNAVKAAVPPLAGGAAAVPTPIRLKNKKKRKGKK